MRIIVGISGASGVIYGIRTIEVLRELNVETHLIVTGSAVKIARAECDLDREDITKMADKCYDVEDLTAPISSGSFLHDGMVIIPCSMKTLSGIATGYADNLLLRAADVCLKERRKLILVPRETPLNMIHIRNMLTLAEAGAIILPAMPAFYGRPKSVDELINYVVGRVLDQLGISHSLYRRWKA
ncbi:MAG: UbiX family flavin prenyltransferase [Nitrososphaerota archaeon]|nr:UbiX family flavin prenyltransferase [Candidatus Bathyarchaeota archaeon]MDW8194081.1 UbiX family flavin prenyltransferase [Nitrososphaerota archaeon]